ncbi:GNAT family N-acetyltransferase [Roseovarius pelagicus]|uniref:GNAT family N-acetyltransferase n=1 Tax=Roseovarius pelagicus TaxID=2980108 RepID=A0ABY6DFI2_9RHOB|nr:GNAT family N-acetyltransferase [Roseovarius pelagicus]UXX83728.1 GNAT family N-acetyltransferase [Roseovarius pelagicus]
MQIVLNSPDQSPALPGGAIQQHPNYAAALGRMGLDMRAAEFYCDGRYLGRSQFALRRFGPLRVAWMPRGPVWRQDTPPPDQDLQNRMMAGLRRAVRLRALWAISNDCANHAPGLRAAGPRQVAELSLTTDSIARRAAMHGKWRNRLRRAERNGLRITSRVLSLPRDTALLQRELDQRRASHYAALPPAFTVAWVQAQPQATRLFAVHEGTDVIAYILLLLHAPQATYHIGWSGSRGRTLCAHNLAVWHATEWLAARGYARLDLGLIDPVRTPSLDRFKLGCGARARSIGATTVTARL